MKKFWMLVLPLLACAGAPPPVPTVAADPPVVQLTAQTPKEIKVAPHTLLDYAYPSWASVGYGSLQKLDSDGAVILKDQHIDFEQTAEQMKGKTGADKGTGHYIFQAVRAGQAKLVLEDWSRGVLQGRLEFTVTVE